jgi:L,D-transpeptidase ErfK/SrfK
MKLPVMVLVCVLAVSLSASLYRLASIVAEASVCSALASETVEELARVSAQRDTLARVNHAFALRADSTAILRRTVDSLQVRLLETELIREYNDYYLLIDTYQNRFHLRRGGLLVRSGYCGTGKGWTSNDQGMVWDFSTPRGLRYVIKKGDEPYWYRPDWYWHEQNLRPPLPGQEVVIPQDLSWSEQIVYYNDSLTAQERVWVRAVPGALGSYKLDLGGGILLHYGVGRGRNVSHGCIRLSSEDLEALYRTLPVGAPVLIY